MPMAIALNKNNNDGGAVKRGPIANWLGRKGAKSEGDALPDVNVQAGVDRALKNTSRPPAGVEMTDGDSPGRDALGAIEAALYAIDKMRDTVEEACELVLSAREVEDAGARALLAERYDEMRLSIDKIIEDLDPRATSLIGKSRRHLDVNLGGKTRYSVSPIRLDTSEQGLNLSPPRNAFAEEQEIDATLEELDRAIIRADRAAGNYCRDAQYLIARMNSSFG